MIKTRLYFLILLPLLLTLSCYKDTDSSEEPEVIIAVAPVIVNTIINGHLSDLNGDLISDYSLIINDELFAVENSYFSFQVNGVNKKGQLIYALKDGEIIALKSFLPIENDINRLELIAFPQWTTNTINANDNSIFSINQDITINFSRAAFFDNQGINSTPSIIQSGVFSSQNQASNFGFNADGSLTALEVLGGFYLQFENGNGEKLNIIPEQPASVSIDPVSERSDALYWLDSEKQIWVEIGAVYKGSIETEIKSGGYFIIAKAAKGVFVEGQNTKENLPVAYQKYEWEIDDIFGQYIGTESGKWLTVLPQHSAIELNFLNPCDEQIQNQIIITKAKDIEDENLTVNTDNENYQFLSTRVVDCNGDIENTQTIHLNIDNNQGEIFAFQNDEIKAWLPVCSPFSISAYDIATDTKGPNLAWSTEITDDLSYLTNCADLTDGFTYLKIGGETKLFSPFIVENDGIQSLFRSQDDKIRLTIQGTTAGAFEENQVNIYINDPNFGTKGYYISCENSNFGCGIEDPFISHYNLNPDGTVRLSFSGRLWMRTIEPVVAGYYDIEGVILIQN